MNSLNGIFIIPTGLGCALGGDAAFNSGVKLIAACSNNLIVNPNAVNASDINEIQDNCLYVEGSTIDRFLEGKLNLKKIKTHNRILMIVNKISHASVNSKNAGIWSLGAEIELLELLTPLKMKAIINPDGTAGGIFSGVDELIKQVESLDFDALAIQTPIECDDDIAKKYWTGELKVNPWGGVEALVSKEIASKINKPVAHAPIETEWNNLYQKITVKQSMSPEIISNTYTFCILKGLHRAPNLEFLLRKQHSDILSVIDMDFLVTPHGCWGRPHIACHNARIPIIVVSENTTCFSKNFEYPTREGIIFVANYLGAAGVISALSCGMDYRTVLLDGDSLH